jgi:hypothetical protein
VGVKIRLAPKAALIASAALLAGAAIAPAVAAAAVSPPATDGSAAAYSAVFDETAPEAGAAAQAKRRDFGWFGPLAALAGFLVGALSWRHLKSAIRRLGPTAAAAVGAVAAAPQAAAAAIGKVAAAPIRYLAAMLGLIVFSLFGFSAFDLEWLAGAIAGAAGALMLSLSALRLRRIAGAVLAGVAGAGR